VNESSGGAGRGEVDDAICVVLDVMRVAKRGVRAPAQEELRLVRD